MVSPCRWPEAHPKGGLNLIEDEKSRSIVVEILKSMGRKILEGKFNDIMRISRPACISYPMTYLQAASRDFSYCRFLTQAATESDPILRLQLICAFIISGLHINPTEFKNKPPLNPILGETHTAELSDGTKIWLEQTCHHPPITHWYMVGPNDLYVFHGHGQIIAGLAGPNTIKAGKQGKHIIRFSNGDVVEYTAPNMKISGVVLGQRNVNFHGTFEVTDVKNQFAARITFEEDPGVLNSIKGKLTGFLGAKKQIPSDFFNVKIYMVSDDNCTQKDICEGFGSWLEYIKFGDRVYWSIDVKPEENWVVSSDHLPSDSIYREDLQHLKQDNESQAQIEKDRLENIQRRDKVLRAQNAGQ